MTLPFAWRGNTSNTATSPVQNLPNMLDSFSIVNKTVGGIGFNVYLINGVSQICLTPNTTELAQGEMALFDRQVVVLASEQLKIQTSGSVDYDFTFKGLK